MNIINLMQGSEEWHELRRKSIGASDCSVIMGNNPWKSEYQLFQEKKGLYQQPNTDAMSKGTALEPLALAKFCEKTGNELRPIVIQSKERHWQIASLDGISEDLSCMVEIKCSEKLYEMAKNNIIPEYYIDQMQHQLCVSGNFTMSYFAFWNDEGIEIPIERNEEYISKIIEKETMFYQRMIQYDCPEAPFIERDDEEWVFWANTLKTHQILIKENEAVIQQAKDKLIELCDEKPCKGGGVYLQKVMRKGSIPYSEIEFIKKMDLEIYRKPETHYWKVIDVE